MQSVILPPRVEGRWLPMSYEEFLAWAPEGARTEWTEGEGIVYVTAGDRHQAMMMFASSLLGEFVRLFGLGRVSIAPYPMELRPGGPHREPDVLFVSAAHLDRWTPQRLKGPADLAFEFLSEDTAAEGQGRKRREFELLGVPEYVMADSRPRRYDFAYLRLDARGKYQEVAPDAQERYHSQVVPGFWLDSEWFRQDPLPNPLAVLRRISAEAWHRLVAEVEEEG